MDTFLVITAIVSLAVPLYVYFGYPVLLGILSTLFPAEKVKKKEIYPSVTLIISCYNEERIIAEKLENALALHYPQDKLEIYIVSDASTDDTDRIALNFADRGVRFVRVEGRVGKTACLNVVVPRASGNIIVFSDANAMYDPDAIRCLVANFADNQVGYVVGEARYADADSTAAAKSEDSYWQYEILIKKMESRLHSMVGGDGAIYAIRKELYQQLDDTDINDFVNPLQIISKGYRGIYEPEAICYENTSGSFGKEFRRKVRIVNRSFSGLLKVKSVLNPLKVGLFSLEIFSHKLLRWFVPFFLLTFIVSTLILAARGVAVFQYLSVLTAVFLVCADIGYVLSAYQNTWSIFYLPYYFVSVNAAALIGVIRRLRGTTQVIWDTPRTGEHETAGVGWASVFTQLVAGVFFLYILFFCSRLVPVNILTYESAFWGAFFFIFYVYFGYPLVLFAWASLRHNPLCPADISPDVSLLICAYNEEDVIEEKIQNSLELNYPKNKLHIIVASDGSTDKTNDIVRIFSAKKSVSLFAYKQRTGKIGAILQTIPALTSEIVVFSDANTMYAPDALRKLVRSFNDPKVGGVSADVILLNDETTFGESESAYYKYERWIQAKESEIDSIIGADGGMYAIRRNLFVPPSPNIILDDFVISMNVVLQGRRLVYEPDAKGYERSTISHYTEFLRKSRVIAGAVQALKQAEGIPSPSSRGLFFAFFSHKFLRWLVPLMLLTLLFTNIVLSIQDASFFYRFFLLLQALFYTLAVIGWLIGGESRFQFIGIPFYFCLVNGAALYGLYKGCLNKQPVTWKKFSRN